jgi:V/A-type H+/Na+-transporting ATPase subunit A
MLSPGIVPLYKRILMLPVYHMSKNRTEISSILVSYSEMLAIVCWVDRMLAVLELLRRGNDVEQMMQVTGEERVSLEDHLVHQKALFLDMVYFEQDAFDKVNAGAALPRQKRIFDLVFDLVNRNYQFPDKSAIRDYFVRLTGLFKNLNHAEEQTPEYKESLNKIRELADFSMNQNVR